MKSFCRFIPLYAGKPGCCSPLIAVSHPRTLVSPSNPRTLLYAWKLGCWEARMLLSAYNCQPPSNPCITLGPSDPRTTLGPLHAGSQLQSAYNCQPPSNPCITLGPSDPLVPPSDPYMLGSQDAAVRLQLSATLEPLYHPRTLGPSRITLQPLYHPPTLGPFFTNPSFTALAILRFIPGSAASTSKSAVLTDSTLPKCFNSIAFLLGPTP